MAEALPISVVIPAYNRAGLIARALQSVAAQAAPPAEVIVVDDCSQDDTADVAEALGARVIRHEHNRGESGARNTGLAAATQPWIATLDSDDEWLPCHLETAWSVRGEHVLCSTSCIEVVGQRVVRVRGALGSRPRVVSTPADLLWPYNFVTASAVVVRRDVAQAVGGYPEGIRYAPDLEFLARVLKRGSLVVSPEIGAIWHTHGDQISGDMPSMQAGHTDVLARHRAEWDLTDRLEARWQGAAAWDTFRAAQRSGDRAAARRAAREMVAGPQRAVGVLGLLGTRALSRRRGAAVGADGRPTIAVLPGAQLSAEDRRRLDEAGHVRDLHAKGPVGALADLVRRPAGRAVAGSPPQAWVARLAGVAPERPGA